MEHKYTAIPPPTNTYTTTPDVGAHGVGNSADAPSSGNVSPSTKVSTYSIAPSKPPPGQRTLSDDGSPSTATPTRRHALVFANWWLEIGACCLFIIALVAIFATLYPHQGKPQPQWPYGISVNSLIAIYVVVFKSAVSPLQRRICLCARVLRCRPRPRAVPSHDISWNAASVMLER